MLHHDAFNSVEATFEEEFIEENASDPLCDYREPLEVRFFLLPFFLLLWYDQP